MFPVKIKHCFWAVTIIQNIKGTDFLSLKIWTVMAGALTETTIRHFDFFVVGKES